MMTAKNKKRLIITLIVLFFTWPLLLLLIPSDNDSSMSAEQKLVALMPTPPSGAVLIGEGFSPEARCLDKCGHYDRIYDYSSISDICFALTMSIKNDAHGYVFGKDYKSTASLTPEECDVALQKYASTAVSADFSLNKGGTKIVEITVNTNKKQLLYIAEEGADYYFNNPSPR